MKEIRSFGARLLAVAALFVLSCTAEPALEQRHEPDTVRTCPEAVYIDASGIPRSVTTRQIRWCFPGEANCYCDRDNDCYRLDGYVPCAPPTADAASTTDAATEAVVAPLCSEAVYTDASGIPRSVTTRQIRWCFPGEAHCYCDRDNDCYRLDGYVPCTPVSPTTDASTDAATTDVVADTSPDVAADTSASGVCPEAVYTDASGIPRSVTTRQIRWCFPGEAHCYCDRDNDCYRLDGYVSCTPVTAGVDASTDSATTDVASDAGTDTSPDVAADTTADATVDASAPGSCPEAVYIDASGIPRSVTTRQIRWCFPGEAHCYCDRDNDCYRLDGYVPCAPVAATPDAGADATVDTTPDGSSDAATEVASDTATTDSATLAPDPVTYSGSFSGASGLTLQRLTAAGLSRDVWVYAPTTRGARPPLVLAFHGTNGDGALMINESGAQAMADANGVVVVAPTSRWFGSEGRDYDHPEGNGTYWETRTTDPDTNADLVLVRAAIVEAQLRYNTDPDRVYAIGHSNGGFMALMVSLVLRERIAAFAENSAGLVTCATRPSCGFVGSSLTCGGLASESGWCTCTGTGLPLAPVPGRAAPGYLSHGVNDPIVSVFYTCALAQRLAAAGVPVQTYLWSGGHYLSSRFAANAWSFLAPFRRP